MKTINYYLNKISKIDHKNCRDFKECKNADEYVIEKLKHLIITDFKNNIKNTITMEKLTAYQIWKKKQNENLSDEQYKQLLIENGVVILKPKPSKELLTMLTSFVQGNKEDYAIEVYNLCVKEFSEGKKDSTGERQSNISDIANQLEKYLDDLDNLIETGHFPEDSVKDHTFYHKDLTLNEFIKKGREYLRQLKMKNNKGYLIDFAKWITNQSEERITFSTPNELVDDFKNKYTK